MNERLLNVQADIDRFESLKITLQPEFEAIIKDKSIPLDERWDFFRAAPDSLKSEECYGPHMNCLDQLDVSYYDDFYLERHQTTKYEYLVERVWDNQGGWKGRLEVMNTPEFLNEMKEEILQENAGCFTYDW